MTPVPSRRTFLKALLAAPVAGVLALDPRLAAHVTVSAKGVTVPLSRFEQQILFHGNLLVRMPRTTGMIVGITD